MDFRDVHVLITGGAGFIGSHLVEELLRLGARVRVLDNFSTGKPSNLEHCGDRIELQEGDIRDMDACRQAVEAVHVVFHQAALGSVPRSMEDPATTMAVNVAGTANVFTAARDAKVARVVYASSSVYGDSEKLPKREGQEGRPLSPYALSKVMNEEIAGLFARLFEMELIGLRYFNVYGPRQDPAGPYAAVIPKFFAALASGKPPLIYGDGEQSRDFTFVEDAVAANLLAAAAPQSAIGRAYNIAAGRRTTVRELAMLVRELVGKGPQPECANPRSGDVLHSLADPTAAREALGFCAQFSVEEGLAKTHEYYIELGECFSGEPPLTTRTLL